MNNFSYETENSIEAAFKKLNATKNAKILAGGTNLIDLWKYNLEHPEALIDINKIESLNTIHTLDSGELHLGATATNSQTAYHPEVISKYPLLNRTILAGASEQIRNSATNGGNLLQRTRCYYFYDYTSPCNKRVPGSGCPAINGQNRLHAIIGHSPECIAVFPSDMCVALSALDAKIIIQKGNVKREISIIDFHRLPGDTPYLDNNLKNDEIITAIILPEEGYANNYSYLKLRDRLSYAFALVSVATGFVLENDTIKKIGIALGGIAHKPWRKLEAEHFLIGKKPKEENFEKAADIILENAKGFEHNNFKIKLAKKAIVRNGIMALNPSCQLPGAQPSL